MGKGGQGALFDARASKQGFDAELDAMFSAPPAPLPRVEEHGMDSTDASTGVSQAKEDEAEEEDEENVEDEDEEDEEDEEDGQSETDEEQAADQGATAEGTETDTDADAAEEEEAQDDEASERPTSQTRNDSLEEMSDVEDMTEEQLKAFLDAPTQPKTKRQLEDANDDELARNQRTLFIGNIPMDAAKSRPLRKQLIRFLEQISPYPECTKIVSLRFRSVSFKMPTNDFAQDEQAASAAQRRRERARKFRELQGTTERDAPPPSQPLLTAQQKRKIAFINQEMNERADAVNAYIRLGEPRLVHAELEKRHKGEAPLDARVSGHILAALLVRAIDNTQFGTRHLRADLVVPLAPQEIIESGLDKVRLADGSLLGGSGDDLKRTLFVGNLDFEAGEEELRALFEKLVREERGAPPAASATSLRLDGKPSAASRTPEWVQSVRIVRDKATQLGKGFAYVKFWDTACVDELLALHEAEEAFVASKRPQARGKTQRVAKPIVLADGETFRRRVKLRKRALRLSRCKNTQGSEPRRAKRKTDEPPRTPTKRRYDAARARSSGAPTPNGSSPTPRTAEEQASNATYLATLPKEQRILTKKNDAERQARRLQKKQAKRATEKTERKLGARRDKVPLPQRSTARKMAKSHK